MDAKLKVPNTVMAGLKSRCPRCGEGHVFSRFLTIAPRCEACGLDFSFAEPADGPAFFVMSGVGILVTALWALWAIALQPPVWAQFAVVFPGLIGGCLATLRPVKAWLIAEQYVRKAGESEWVSLGTHGKAPKGYNAGRW